MKGQIMPRVKTARIGPPMAPKMERAMRSTPAGATSRRKATPIMKRPKKTAEEKKNGWVSVFNRKKAVEN